MEFTESVKKDFCIIYLNGRIDSKKAPEFEQRILSILERGENKIIINCRDLRYISSLGLRIFLTAQKKIIAHKGTLYLCELMPQVLETVAISGFSSIFKIFETEEEALEA